MISLLKLHFLPPVLALLKAYYCCAPSPALAAGSLKHQGWTLLLCASDCEVTSRANAVGKFQVATAVGLSFPDSPNCWFLLPNHLQTILYISLHEVLSLLILCS